MTISDESILADEPTTILSDKTKNQQAGKSNEPVPGPSLVYFTTESEKDLCHSGFKDESNTIHVTIGIKGTVQA